MNLSKLALTSLVILITGCSTTGGTIGGLFPAPKFMAGSIDKKTYLSKNKDFSITIPHEKGSYQYKYMKIKEQYGDLGAYISFGPAAFDQSIYRLEIGKKLTPNRKNFVFEDAVDKIIENYAQQLEANYKSKPKLEKREIIHVNGKKSFYFKFRQEIASGILISNTPATLIHEGIATDYENLAAFVWVQRMADEMATKNSSLSVKGFAESFSIIAK
ncbi:MAG: hypothetical protein L3J98_05025 [Gammaproteobacteria bacterium]|nr:hypothetical protein [Gammaproteobacteria bacterium]